MNKVENSELCKVLKHLVLFEKEAYQQYCNAIDKMQNPKCITILQLVCNQTKEHLHNISDIYNRIMKNNETLMRSNETLDKETSGLLLFMKSLLQNNPNPKEVMKSCCVIEGRMSKIYKEIANEKKLELEFQKLLGKTVGKKAIDVSVKIIMKISEDEENHRKLFTEIYKKM